MSGEFIGGVIVGIVLCVMALFCWGACTLSAKADRCEAIWLEEQKKK
jgi:hypothetical protein